MAFRLSKRINLAKIVNNSFFFKIFVNLQSDLINASHEVGSSSFLLYIAWIVNKENVLFHNYYKASNFLTNIISSTVYIREPYP